MRRLDLHERASLGRAVLPELASVKEKGDAWEMEPKAVDGQFRRPDTGMIRVPKTTGKAEWLAGR